MQDAPHRRTIHRHSAAETVDPLEIRCGANLRRPLVPTCERADQAHDLFALSCAIAFLLNQGVTTHLPTHCSFLSW